jgi:glycerophosphoryl diester phosphodiesterase
MSIEIKSSWTYNKNGKDKILEEKNKIKWKTAKSLGLNFRVLFSKNDIDNLIIKILKYNERVK